MSDKEKYGSQYPYELEGHSSSAEGDKHGSYCLSTPSSPSPSSSASVKVINSSPGSVSYSRIRSWKRGELPAIVTGGWLNIS